MTRMARHRVRMTVAYDGTGYVGWQRQINGVSIQELLERALSALTKEPVAVTGASRTDAGVHALGQVVHFDTSSAIPDDKFPLAVNTKLPPSIRVLDAVTVPDDFHARYHARKKRYRYSIHNARCAPVLERSLRWHIPYPLDIGVMAAEAHLMEGAHDFAAFAASGSIVKDTARTVFETRVRRADYDHSLIEIWISGNGFLYNMVRILAGTLAEVGCGKRAPGAVSRAIETRDRLVLGQTAPPQGLTLMQVDY